VKTALYRYLDNLGACDGMLVWVERDRIETLEAVWDRCYAGSWMIHLVTSNLGNIGWPTHQEVLLTLWECIDFTLNSAFAKNSNFQFLVSSANTRANGANYDSLLTWDILYRYTARLLNQTKDRARYEFLDSIRFLALFATNPDSIVAATNAIASAGRSIYYAGDNQYLELADIVRKHLYIGRVEL
jgi:hypothetical protein